MFTLNKLPLSEKACASTLKSVDICINCKRDVDLSEAHLFEYWTEPFLITNLKDGYTRCNSFLRDEF